MLPVAFLLAVLFASPAIPQGTEGKVEDMETVVSALREKVSRQEAQIKEIVAYLQAQKAEAKALREAIEGARTGGFIPSGANPGSRETLLNGLETYAERATLKVPGTPSGEEPSEEPSDE
ncbi:MAG: hypothetical protein ACT4PV_06730 [Planctomycetaceae bacterium]